MVLYRLAAIVVYIEGIRLLDMVGLVKDSITGYSIVVVED